MHDAQAEKEWKEKEKREQEIAYYFGMSKEWEKGLILEGKGIFEISIIECILVRFDILRVPPFFAASYA